MEVIKPNLQKAAEAIKKGKILVCPTDTVYGLVCDASNKKAVDKIYLIKQRLKSKPLPIFVRSIAMAKKIAKINKIQARVLKKFWPGKITAVLNAKKGGTIGFRVPNNQFVLNLVRHAGPLAETSANISGQPPTIKIKKVLEYFKGRRYGPDLAINAGDLPLAKPSTVIDLTIWPPKILRP